MTEWCSYLPPSPQFRHEYEWRKYSPGPAPPDNCSRKVRLIRSQFWSTTVEFTSTYTAYTGCAFGSAENRTRAFRPRWLCPVLPEPMTMPSPLDMVIGPWPQELCKTEWSNSKLRMNFIHQNLDLRQFCAQLWLRRAPPNIETVGSSKPALVGGSRLLEVFAVSPTYYVNTKQLLLSHRRLHILTPPPLRPLWSSISPL